MLVKYKTGLLVYNYLKLIDVFNETTLISKDERTKFNIYQLIYDNYQLTYSDWVAWDRLELSTLELRLRERDIKLTYANKDTRFVRPFQKVLKEVLYER